MMVRIVLRLGMKIGVLQSFILGVVNIENASVGLKSYRVGKLQQCRLTDVGKKKHVKYNRPTFLQLWRP